MNQEQRLFGQDYRYFLTRQDKARIILDEIKRHTDIRPESKLKVLAVGGEYGFIEYCLSKWTKWQIISSDIDRSLISKYPQLKKHIKIRVLDATRLPYRSASFDLVIFNHVIEHIPSYRKAVMELRRVLKEAGFLYLATPNLKRLFVNPKILFYPKKRLDDNTRIEMHMGFSREELREIFREFAVNEISREHLAKKLGIISKLPEKILPSQTNVFICRK
jgi:SAM-dependent methyltransferase